MPDSTKTRLDPSQRHITEKSGTPTKDFFNFLKNVVTTGTVDTLTNKTLTDPSNVIGGVTVKVGGDQTGDMWYRNAAGIFTRVGIGSAGQVLTAAGGLPSWATPAVTPPGLSYLGTVSAAAGVIADTTILAANAALYRAFRLVLRHILPVAAGGQCLMVLHSGGAFQTTATPGYSYAGSGTSAWSTSTAQSFLQLSGAALTTITPGLTGHLDVSLLNGTAMPKTWQGQVANPTAANVLFNGSLSGFWNGNGAVDGFQIFLASSTITSGAVDIYGII